jgi:hypothetical protein
MIGVLDCTRRVGHSDWVTGDAALAHHRKAIVVRPRRAGAVGFVASVVIGLAIWWPTMAMQPRYGFESDQQGSPWYFPLMLGAAVLLTVGFRRWWWVVGPGLVAGQLFVSPFTTPRGDNDGLWLFIFPMLVVFGLVLMVVSGIVAAVKQAMTVDRRPRR